MREKGQERHLDRLLRESEELLRAVGDPSVLVEQEGAEGEPGQGAGDPRRETVEDYAEGLQLRIRGHAELRVSADEMQVLADFYPPVGDMPPLDPEEVRPELEEKAAAERVDWQAVQEAVFRCNTERVAVCDVVVARGAEPEEEVPEHWAVEEALRLPPPALSPEGGRVDFKEVSPFVLVREAQVLARLVPRRPGAMGATVRGKALPYGVRPVQASQPDANTRVEGETVVACCDGHFVSSPESFQVSPVLELQGDVDYHTGHVEFPGDVVISGQIKDGFRVRAGGSVYCAGTLDASEVQCGMDLLVRRGIIGRKKATVRAGGKVEARFIENCRVEAGGPVVVEVGILHSAVYTRDRVEMGKKGIIVGGRVYAQNGISATQMGSGMEPRTELYCGIDYQVEQKVTWIRDRNVDLSFKLAQVERRLKQPDASSRLAELRERIRGAIDKLNEAANALIFRLDRKEEAEVCVAADLYPGAYVEICHVSFAVTRGLRRVRLRLDKEKGRIVAEPLQR